MKQKFQVGDWVLFAGPTNHDIGKIVSYTNNSYKIIFSSGSHNIFTRWYFESNTVRKLTQDEIMLCLLER